MSVKARLRLEPIRRGPAAAFLNSQHEAGAGQSGSLYLGVFWDDELHGVLAFGSPVSNLAVSRLGLRLREVFELRRMVLDDVPERNTESRALAVAARLIRQHYPHLRALITYCAEDEAAVAYRASGWHCIGISRDFSTVRTESGEVLVTRAFRDRYGRDALKTTPHTKIYRPTQKLALGLDPEIAERVSALAAKLTA